MKTMSDKVKPIDVVGQPGENHKMDEILKKLCELKNDVRASKPFKGKAALIRKIGGQVQFLGRYKCEVDLAESFYQESNSVFNSRRPKAGQEQVGLF